MKFSPKHLFSTRLAVAVGIASLALVGAGCGRPAAAPAAVPPSPPTPAAAPSPSAAAPSDLTGAGCRHPYYPLQNGYEIDYHTTAATPFDYQMKVSDVTADSARLTLSFSQPRPFSVAQDVSCTDGAIRAKGFLDVGGAMGGAVKTETKSVEGDLMPKTLTVGATWTTKYETVVSYEGIKLPPGMKSEFAGEVTVVNRVVAAEKVTVPAGTFDAVKVQVDTSSSSTMPGSPTPTVTKTTAYQWWVLGVGLVKNQDAEGKTVTEATKIVKP